MTASGNKTVKASESGKMVSERARAREFEPSISGMLDCFKVSHLSVALLWGAILASRAPVTECRRLGT